MLKNVLAEVLVTRGNLGENGVKHLESGNWDCTKSK